MWALHLGGPTPDGGPLRKKGKTVQGDPMSGINQTSRRIIYVMMVIVVLLVIWQILTPL